MDQMDLIRRLKVHGQPNPQVPEAAGVLQIRKACRDAIVELVEATVTTSYRAVCPKPDKHEMEDYRSRCLGPSSFAALPAGISSASSAATQWENDLAPRKPSRRAAAS